MICYIFFRIQGYIDNWWDKSRLKDPDCGVHAYELMKENIPSTLTCTQIRQKWGVPSL